MSTLSDFSKTERNAFNVSEYDIGILPGGTYSSDNTAEPLGGSLYVAGASVTINSTLENPIVFQGNSARHGGAVYLDRLTVGSKDIHAAGSMKGVLFSGNEVSSAVGSSGIVGGGALAVVNHCSATLEDVVFLSNRSDANGDGGAIYLSGKQGSITLTNCSFLYNQSGRSGGAINVATGKVILHGTTRFEGNGAAAPTNGGAVYLAAGGDTELVFDGRLELVGENDTIRNSANAKVTWDLTNTTATLENYENLLCWNGSLLNLQVDNSMGGHYVLATGLAETFQPEKAFLRAKNQFTLNGSDTVLSVSGDAIGSTGEQLFYQGTLYQLEVSGEAGDRVLSLRTSGGVFYNPDWTDAPMDVVCEGVTWKAPDTINTDGFYNDLALAQDAAGAYGTIIWTNGGLLKQEAAGGHIYGGDGNLGFAESPLDMSGRYIVGGRLNANVPRASNVLRISTQVTAKALICGDQFQSTFEMANQASRIGANILSLDEDAAGSNITGFIVGGSLLNSNNNPLSRKASYQGITSITIDGNVTSRILTGGSVIGGCSILEEPGTTGIFLSAGNYSYIFGASYLQGEADKTGLSKTGAIDIAITGGSYGYIYGGAGAQSSSYLARAKVSGDITITLDTSKKDIHLISVFGGCSGQAIGFTANTTITFRGDGSRLFFDDPDADGMQQNSTAGVAGGNATRSDWSSEQAAGLTGTNALVFEHFTGDFTAPRVRDFDTFRLEHSCVTFTSALRLQDVHAWNFDGASSLAWTQGENDFADDILDFRNLTGDCCIIDSEANDNLFKGLMQAQQVCLNGQDAEMDLENECWATAEYRLSIDRENHDLVIVKLSGNI